MLYYISEHVTLVKLINTIENVNHAILITGRWIYYSNHKREFPLMKYFWVLMFLCIKIRRVCMNNLKMFSMQSCM